VAIFKEKKNKTGGLERVKLIIFAVNMIAYMGEGVNLQYS
jgi:hypothetical protein